MDEVQGTTIDRSLALDAVRVTEAAALASGRWMGRGNTHSADEAARRAMHDVLRSLDIRGHLVIGEGEKEEASQLYVTERLGRWNADDPAIELAVDPLEGTRACAQGAPNAISIMAMSLGGKFLPVPDVYMNKIAVGPSGRGAIDLSRAPAWNLRSIADAKGVYVEDLTVAVLDRPRHQALIREVREAGARVKLIADGDVSAAIATCHDDSGLDVLMGIGGAPEGVLAAAALRCVGGDLLCQFRPRNQEDAEQIRRRGIEDVERVYRLDDLASGEVLFAATGVTSGDVLEGVRFQQGRAHTHSVVMRSKSLTVRYIHAEHRFDLLNR
jgi:fructose-1,6-bisphosphatase II